MAAGAHAARQSDTWSVPPDQPNGTAFGAYQNTSVQGGHDPYGMHATGYVPANGFEAAFDSFSSNGRLVDAQTHTPYTNIGMQVASPYYSDNSFTTTPNPYGNWPQDQDLVEFASTSSPPEDMGTLDQLPPASHRFPIYGQGIPQFSELEAASLPQPTPLSLTMDAQYYGGKINHNVLSHNSPFRYEAGLVGQQVGHQQEQTTDEPNANDENVQQTQLARVGNLGGYTKRFPTFAAGLAFVNTGRQQLTVTNNTLVQITSNRDEYVRIIYEAMLGLPAALTKEQKDMVVVLERKLVAIEKSDVDADQELQAIAHKVIQVVQDLHMFGSHLRLDQWRPTKAEKKMDAVSRINVMIETLKDTKIVVKELLVNTDKIHGFALAPNTYRNLKYRNKRGNLLKGDQLAAARAAGITQRSVANHTSTTVVPASATLNQQSGITARKRKRTSYTGHKDDEDVCNGADDETGEKEDDDETEEKEDDDE